MKKTLIFIFCLTQLCTQVCPQACDDIQERSWGNSRLYKKYINRRKEFDARYAIEHYMEGSSYKELNLSLLDIRKFIREVVRNHIKYCGIKINKYFLVNILNIHGHLIKFLENAYVNLKTKKVFEKRSGMVFSSSEAMPLLSYWAEVERDEGLVLHWYKFYASCIDYLILQVRSHLLFPCHGWEELSEMGNWMHWLTQRLQMQLVGNLTFGGYYRTQVELFQEMFKKWSEEFKKRAEEEGIEAPRREWGF